MLNCLVIAAAGVLGWFGQTWLWILPLAVLASLMTVGFPPARLTNLRARGALLPVFWGGMPIQTLLVAALWLAGHGLHA